MQLYVDTLEKAGASQSQMTFFMEAIANDATMLLPLLRNNGTEMERFGDLAQELGAVLDSDTLAAMQRVRESSAQVSMVFEGMRNEVMKELAPSIEALANKFVELSRAGEPINVAFRTAVDNMDRLAIYAGTAGAAVIALNVSLTALRAALIRTGIGAVVVAAGELIYQFVDLTEKTGSVAVAFSHIGSVAVEIFNRVITMGQAMGQALATVALQFKADFLNAFAWVAQGFADMMAKMLSPLNAMLDLMGSEPVANFGQNIADGLRESAMAAQFAATKGESATKKLLDAATAPLETVKKFRDQVAAASDADAWDNYIKSTNKASGATNKLGDGITGLGEKKKKAKKAAREVTDEYGRWLDKMQDATRQLELEAATFGMSEIEATRYKLTIEGLNTAKEAGRQITDKLTAEIDKEVERHIRAKSAVDEHKKAVEALNQIQDLVSATWVRALEDMILNAESLTDAIKGIGEAWSKASLDALLTGKGPLAQFTGLASNDPNNPNAIGGIFGVLMGNQNKLLKDLPKNVRSGAEAGTEVGAATGTAKGLVDSGMSGWLQQNGKTILGVGAGLTSLVGAYGTGLQGGNMGMAGIGGAISGVTGGLSLATGLGLSSAMMGPLAGVGALVGAGISIMGNQQARKQAKQQRMEEARAAYEEAIPQIESFTKALRGEITGSLQQTIDEVHAKANELGKVAFFAYQFDEVKRIENEFNAYVDKTREEFRDGYAGMLDQLTSGGGMSGAFSSARNEMQTLGDELLTWVEDVKEAFRVWDGAEAAEATSAAQKAALSILEPVESLSAVQTAMQQINGRAAALHDILVDLHMSSDDATRAIEGGVLRAMDALRISFSDDLTSRLDAAAGRDHFNEVRDLLAEIDQLTSDATALGVDEFERISTLFSLSAQEIVDGADLTGSAFNDLIVAFPQLSGVVVEAGQAITNTAEMLAQVASRLQTYEDRYFTATNDNSTLDGALLEFDRAARREREAEFAAGGQAIVALERALAAERLNIQQRFADQAVTAAEQAVSAARQNLQAAAQAAIDAAQDIVSAAQEAASAAAQAVSQAQSRVDAAQQALERAQDAIRQGYEDQAAALRDTVSRLQSFIKGIQDFKRSLVLDDALSPFSPAQRLAEAQAQFQDISARALSGDTDAMDKLQQVSRDYLSEARDYYASSDAYYQAFSDVQSILDQASSTAQSQLTEAERQLAALDAQIAALTRIEEPVMSIAQAQQELLAAQAELTTAQQQQSQADAALTAAQANLDAVQQQMDALLGINNSVMSVEQAIREMAAAEAALAAAQSAQMDIIAQQLAMQQAGPGSVYDPVISGLYQDVLGRTPDATGAAYWAADIAKNNWMGADLEKAFVGGAIAAGERHLVDPALLAKYGLRMGGIVGSYATGGIVGNGMYNVDSVLAKFAGGGHIALAGGEYVTRAPSVNRDTLPTLAAINSTGRPPSANDDSARDEIRALRQEVTSLKNELKQVLAAGFSATVASTSETTGAVRETNRRMQQASGTR